MTEPIEPEFYEMMNALAHGLDELFNGAQRPKKVGFVLLSFYFGDQQGGRVNYISNGKREDIVTALKELLARFEGRVPPTPETKQ